MIPGTQGVVQMLRKKRDDAAIGTPSYGGVLEKLGHSPAADWAYIKAALSPAAMFAGPGVQDNRRKLEARLKRHGLGYLLETNEETT